MSNSISIYRDKAGISQKALGQLCGWGAKAQSRISNYEAERRSISAEDLKKIKDVINDAGVKCSIEDLIAPAETTAA